MVLLNRYMLSNEERGIIATYIDKAEKIFNFSTNEYTPDNFIFRSYVKGVYFKSFLSTLSLTFNKEYNKEDKAEISKIFDKHDSQIDEDFNYINDIFSKFLNKAKLSEFYRGKYEEMVYTEEAQRKAEDIKEEAQSVYLIIEDFLRRNALDEELEAGIEHCHFHIPCSNCRKPMHFDESDANWQDEIYPAIRKSILSRFNFDDEGRNELGQEYIYHSLEFEPMDFSRIAYKIGVEHEHIHFQVPANGSMIHFDQNYKDWPDIKESLLDAFSSWSHNSCPE
jgi:hypothetical protein